MCPVVAGIASAVMGGLQTVAAYQGQKQQAEEARRSAVADHNLQTTTINKRMVQEEDAANQKINLQNIQEAQAGADAEVSAAGAGVTGVSLDNILADVSRNAARNRETVRTNVNATAEQLQLQKRGSAANALSRINSVPKPSGLSLVAGLGSAALSGYNTFKKMS